MFLLIGICCIAMKFENRSGLFPSFHVLNFLITQLSICLNIQSSQRFKFTKIQVHKDSSSQRFKFTKIQVHKDSSSQRFKFTKIQVANFFTSFSLSQAPTFGLRMHFTHFVLHFSPSLTLVEQNQGNYSEIVTQWRRWQRIFN